MLPRNFEDKYHSRPHPLLMKCEARAISRDPVLMCAIELRLYAKLVSSAWWRRRLDHAVLFKSFISVTHYPSQRNWWILQIYGIPMPEQVGIFFRGFARLMRLSHCSSGSSLVHDRDDVTPQSTACGIELSPEMFWIGVDCIFKENIHSGHCWIFLDCVISNQWHKKKMKLDLEITFYC